LPTKLHCPPKFAIQTALVLSILFLSRTAFAQEAPFDTEPSQPYSDQQLNFLAGKVGIATEIETVKQQPNSDELRVLKAQNTINKKLASAYLDCSAVNAQLLAEESNVRTRRNLLESKRNTTILTTNSVNFLSRGAISAPAFGYSINPKHLPTDGNILGSVANGTSTLLSVVALAEGRGGKSKAKESASMLAPIFFDGVSHTSFTPYVWIYLNTAPIGAEPSSPTHRQRLVKNWIKAGLCPDPNSSSGRAKLYRLLEIDATGLTISDLRNRETMLHGLRTTILQMTKGLEQLTNTI
jgi:hypothetical protein